MSNRNCSAAVLLLACLGLAGLTRPVAAQVKLLPPGDSSHLTRISDRVVMSQQAGSRMFALKTARGLLFIDTEPTPAATREAIALMEKELGGGPVIALVNTHEHYDHIAGDAAFEGAPIVATQAMVEGLRLAEPQKLKFLPQAEQVVAKARAERDSLKPESPEYRDADARIRNAEAMLAAVRPAVIAPTVSFSDRLTLDLGDRTVRLVAMGRRHSYGDMLIFVPEEHILFTAGAVDPRGYIPFIPPFTRPEDLQRNIAVLTEFADTSLELKRIITGHRPDLTVGDLVFARDYYDRLWQVVARERARGTTLEQAQQRLVLDSAFADLLDKGPAPEASNKTHVKNIETAWALVPVPAAPAVSAAPPRADKAAPTAVKAAPAAKPPVARPAQKAAPATAKPTVARPAQKAAPKQ